MVQGNLSGQRLRLSTEQWGGQGEALARHDGRQVLVIGAIPGEDVVVEVIKDRRSFLAARVVEVLAASPHRVAAPCPYFGPCTGCQWQHVDYRYQLELKRQRVGEALDRAGGFEAAAVSPTVPSPEQYGYRNHARLTVQHDGSLGFVNRLSRRFVLINKCLLMHTWINEALEKLQGRCGETTQLSLRYGTNTGDFLIQPALRNADVPFPTGQKHLREALDGRVFRVASPSFFQVNTRQAEQVVDIVRDALCLSGDELVVDAYAGVGTFSISLAPHVGRVIAIEEAASAVEDAVESAGGLGNIEFLTGKTEEVLPHIEQRVHAVILDPPRVGCARAALEALIKLSPERVVYVSCDPDSLARDLKVLCQEGPYRLESVQPVDMFPQTHHVECVATLSYRVETRHTQRRTAEEAACEGELVLASSSPRRRELLLGLGIKFRAVSPHVSESRRLGESPEDMAVRLALAKAGGVAHSLTAGLVLGADSVVVLDGRTLGKPVDAADARRMLEALLGRVHQVVTGVAVVDVATGWERTGSRVTDVTMRGYSDQEIEAYIASGEPMDKAGAYGVQDKVFKPASSVDGCYANVVGLPVCTLVDLLREIGLGHRLTDRITVPEECSACPLKGSL